jgi:hypothetical protein
MVMDLPLFALGLGLLGVAAASFIVVASSIGISIGISVITFTEELIGCSRAGSRRFRVAGL